MDMTCTGVGAVRPRAGMQGRKSSGTLAVAYGQDRGRAQVMGRGQWSEAYASIDHGQFKSWDTRAQRLCQGPQQEIQGLGRGPWTWTYQTYPCTGTGAGAGRGGGWREVHADHVEGQEVEHALKVAAAELQA